MKIHQMPLDAVIAAAREQAKRERRDYSERVADMLDRLCDEIERRSLGDRASLAVRLQEAARMRQSSQRGEAL